VGSRQRVSVNNDNHNHHNHIKEVINDNERPENPAATGRLEQPVIRR